MMSVDKRYYGLLDIAKLVFCFGVVAIHVSFVLERMSDFWQLLCQLSVPFFFVTSGYLFGVKCSFSGEDEHWAISKKYVTRVLKLYLLWTLIYAPISWMYLLKHHEFYDSLLYYCKGVFLTGQNMMSWHLWYLLALIVAVLLIHFLHRLHLKPYGILLIGFVLFCLGLFLDSSAVSESGWYRFFFEDTKNGLFQGLCYVSIGYCLAYYEKHLRNTMLFVLFVIGCVFLYAQIPLYYPFFALVLVAVLVRVSLNDKFFCKHPIVRSMSTLIYVFHMIPIVIMQQVLHWHFSFHLSFVIVSVLCLVVSYVWVKLSNFPKFSVLKQFY